MLLVVAFALVSGACSDAPGPPEPTISGTGSLDARALAFRPETAQHATELEPGQSFTVRGSDLYGVARRVGREVDLYGEVVHLGATGASGSWFVISDGGVSVALTGHAGWLFARREPPMAAPQPSGSGSGLVVLGAREALRVAGTNVMVATGSSGPAAAFAAWLVDGAGVPVDGSFALRIDDGVIVADEVERWPTGKVFTAYRSPVAASSSRTPVPVTNGSASTAIGRGAASTTLPTDMSIKGPIAIIDPDGLAMQVKLITVVDGAPPAAPADDPGVGFVLAAVTLQLSNDSSSEAVGDSAAVTQLVGNDGRRYFAEGTYHASGCTAFTVGSGASGYSLPPGGAVTGCVAFVLPKNVAVAQVNYANAALWSVG